MSEPTCSKCNLELKYTNSSWCSSCINKRKRELRSEKRALGLKAFGEKRNRTCRKCGNQKEDNYMNDSLCQSCRSETNRDRRIVSRAKKGLHRWGSGRKNTCSSCGNPKELGRENESRCKSCRSEAYKANRVKGRIEMGLRPLGSGRKETCCRCGEIKENIEYGYCATCDALNKSERRFRNVATEEGKMKEKLSYLKKTSQPFFLIKKTAREVLNRCVYAGILQRKPCEVCGKEKTDAHHDDYMKPLDVRWLCRKHHSEHHRKLDKPKEDLKHDS